MGLGQERDREGEVVGWKAALSAPGRDLLFATAAAHMQLTPWLDTGAARPGRGGVCEGCAAEPLAGAA